MLYRYEAVDEAGRTTAGTAEAGSPADARAQLRERGLIAFEVRQARPEARKERPRAESVSWLNLSGRRLDLLTQAMKHLALLLKAGVPLGQGLGILAGQVEDQPFREVIEHVASAVKEGADIDQALGAHPRYFPELTVHVVRAGVQAGELPQVLIEIAAYYARQKKIRDRVVSALTYPALMGLVGGLVLVFLLGFVVPKVTSVLLEQKRVLPWPTEVLLWVSGTVTAYWWALVPGLLLAGLAGARYFATSRGRRIRDGILLRVPVLGDLFRKQIVARWAGTMSTLLASGIPVAQALSAVRGAVGSAAMSDDVSRLEREVLEGSSLSEALKRSRILPPAIGFVAGVGEETGGLHEVLREVADSYNDEVDIASGRLTELLNPVLIVVLGLIVGFIVAAILLPITDFSNVQ
ncbi:MAG TPA: type II secretion system F family protein [Planctomycetota bacterium]|nr:type II secretion system F family protein [Planctomycetota bacterium]